MEKTIFQRIMDREIPSSIVFENEGYIAIKDINPQAPVHFLVIPKAFSTRLDEITDPLELGKLYAVAVQVARAHLTDYMLVTNVGAGAGQTVFHTHIHILGGWDTPPKVLGAH